MGKGDVKTYKGKLFRKSHGKKRPRNNDVKTGNTPAKETIK